MRVYSAEPTRLTLNFSVAKVQLGEPPCKALSSRHRIGQYLSNGQLLGGGDAGLLITQPFQNYKRVMILIEAIHFALFWWQSQLCEQAELL